MTGAVSGEVFLGGTFSAPVLRGRFDSDLTWLRHPVHVTGELDASRNRLDIKQMELTSGAGTLSAKGSVDLTGAETFLNVNAREIEMSLLQSVDDRIPPQLDGRVQADLTIKGSRERPDIAGTAQFAGSYQEIPVNLSVNGQGNRSRFSITELMLTTSGAGRLILRGDYDEQSGADFKLDATALPAQLLRRRDWELPPGNIDAVLAIRGTLQQPDAAGNISYLQTRQGEGGAAILSTIDAQLALNPERLNILLTLAGENARSGNIRISLPWRNYLQRPDTESLAQLPLAGTIHAEAYLQEICALLLDPDIHDCNGWIQSMISTSIY